MRNKVLALCLGSNLGDPLSNLRAALFEIKKSRLFKVITVSSIYESEALLPPAASVEWQLGFLNSVVVCELILESTPEDILTEVKRIEKKIGRIEGPRWAPRLIDIDIIYWSGQAYKSPRVSIPHERLLERPFALLPLLEVWPRPELSPLPGWSRPWVGERPFGTRKSSIFFWPQIVGVLNITTDSFSDGGMFLNAESLDLQTEKLIQQGANILEIGAESTRPGARVVTQEQEFNNLNWALKEIKKNRADAVISVDCRHPVVLRKILEKHRLNFLNDVTGFRDPAMQEILRDSGLPAFLMHAISVPPVAMEIIDIEANPAHLLTEWWRRRVQELDEAGIAETKLIFDPGIGFGKSAHQSLYLLRHLEEFHGINSEIMIGHSRKSYQKEFSGRSAPERDLETALITQQINMAYVQYLRVHDVASQLIAMRSK